MPPLTLPPILLQPSPQPSIAASHPPQLNPPTPPPPHRYWHSQGYAVLVLEHTLNLLALGFTLTLSTVLVWFVDWGALNRTCLFDATCDLSTVLTTRHSLYSGFNLRNIAEIVQVVMLTLFWVYAALRAVRDAVSYREMAFFCRHKMGLTDRELRVLTWPEVVTRVVKLQRVCRLCIVRDHTEADVMQRIMRQDNYLVAMINKRALPT